MHKEQPALRVQQVHKAKPVLLAQPAQPALRVHKAVRALRVLRVQQAQKVG